jgi:hypothetical protein
MFNIRENLNCINVGFIGGCINFPNGISSDKVYHYLLEKKLFGIEINIDKYLAYSELAGASEELIRRKSIDVLFVFMRYFPYMILNKPLIKLYGKNKEIIYRLHPYLINHKLKVWPKKLDKYTEESKNNKIPSRKYFGFRDINLILGKVLGLHNWAFRYVERKIMELNELCISNKIKLVVIGPTQNPETFMGDRICTYLNNRMKNTLLINDIDFIDIGSYFDENNNSIFQQDKIHFNEYGHQYLFKKLLRKIEFLQLTNFIT